MPPEVTPTWLRRMFGRIAGRYDLTNAIISVGLVSYWRWYLARRVTLLAVGVVIDVACGTGGVMYQMARRCGREIRIIGIDFTEAMMRVGKARLARKRLHPHLNFCAADALNLPCAADSCDAMTMMFGLRNFCDPQAGLAECYRVLRPGGRLYVLEFSWPQSRLLRVLYGGYFRYMVPLIAWPFCGELMAYRYLRDSVLAFRQRISPDNLLLQVGFTEVRTMPLSGGITTVYEGCKPMPGCSTTQETDHDRLAHDSS